MFANLLFIFEIATYVGGQEYKYREIICYERS